MELGDRRAPRPGVCAAAPTGLISGALLGLVTMTALKGVLSATGTYENTVVGPAAGVVGARPGPAGR